MTARRTILHRSGMNLAKERTMIAPVRRTRGGAPVLRPDREPVFGVPRRLHCPNRSPTGLKPFADGIRNMPPLGLPKREGRPERTSRRTGGVARSQVDPPQGGTGAHGQRHGRWRDHSPLRIPDCMDGQASPAFVRPPAVLREVRLNGSPRALAEVSRYRRDGGGRRVPDAAPTGGSDAAYVGQPAYPVSYTGAGEGWPPPPPSIPPLFALPWRSRAGAPPPFPRAGAA